MDKNPSTGVMIFVYMTALAALVGYGTILYWITRGIIALSRWTQPPKQATPPVVTPQAGPPPDKPQRPRLNERGLEAYNRGLRSQMRRLHPDE